jgi:hypothetical protein
VICLLDLLIDMYTAKHNSNETRLTMILKDYKPRPGDVQWCYKTLEHVGSYFSEAIGGLCVLKFFTSTTKGGVWDGETHADIDDILMFLMNYELVHIDSDKNRYYRQIQGIDAEYMESFIGRDAVQKWLYPWGSKGHSWKDGETETPGNLDSDLMKKLGIDKLDFLDDL